MNAEGGAHLRGGASESLMGSFSLELSTVCPEGLEDRMSSGCGLGDDGVAPGVAHDDCVDQAKALLPRRAVGVREQREPGEYSVADLVWQILFVA